MQVQSNCQCFGLAILTHGGRTEKGEEVLYGTDGGYASLDELIQPLKKKKFGLFAPSHLVGKPKLVFVQVRVLALDFNAIVPFHCFIVPIVS